LRSARLEKILGAIENNLEQIPELKDRLRRLVDGWK
jgi:diglucosylglycerate octanoyltransferase